jgi:type IV pilus assembly protein PilM
VLGRGAYTGIDFGAWSLKAVSITGSKGAYSLKAAAYLKLPNEARAGEASSVCVSDFLKANYIPTAKTAVLMTGHSLMFRHFYLPPMPDKDLKEAVKWEIRKEVAIPAADLVSDFVTTDGAPRPDGKLSITAFAGVRKEIDSIMTLFKNAGVEVRLIEVIPTALLASFCLNNDAAKDENHAMLDIGETKSTLAIIRNRSLAFAREITMGGQDFTRAAAIHLKKSSIDAEEYKRGATQDEARLSLLKPLERLAAELHRSFDYFQAQFREGSVARLYLAGGSAQLKGLDSFISDTTGIPVFVDDPMRKLRATGDGVGALAPCFSTAVGLALRAAGGP